MFGKYLLSLSLFIGILFFSPNQLYAQEEGKIIIISKRVGEEIDKEERKEFGLFPNIKGFQSAVLHKLPDNRYVFRITYLDEQTGELKIERIQVSEESINDIRYQIDVKPWEISEKFQQKPLDLNKDVYEEPGKAIFLELFGKPFYSINIDFRINKSSRFSLGIVPYIDEADEEKGEDGEDGKDEKARIMPNIMYYILQGRNNRFEIGGGFSVIPPWREDFGFHSFVFHGVIGYRYQEKNRPLFRIGFTPLIFHGDQWNFLPWVGISFGYNL